MRQLPFSTEKLNEFIRAHGRLAVAETAIVDAYTVRRWEDRSKKPNATEWGRLCLAYGPGSSGEAQAKRKARSKKAAETRRARARDKAETEAAGQPALTATLASGHTVNTTTGEMLSASQNAIVAVCDNVKNLLLSKKAKYGDSALNPKRIFSRGTPIEQSLVRIDDKLSRIATTGFSAADEDTLQDLIGYLILLKVALKRQEGV